MIDKRYKIINEGTGSIIDSSDNRKEARIIIRKKQSTVNNLKLIDSVLNKTLLSISSRF